MGVKASWNEERKKDIPLKLYIEFLLDAMGKIVGLMLIYSYMKSILENKKVK